MLLRQMRPLEVLPKIKVRNLFLLNEIVVVQGVPKKGLFDFRAHIRESW